MESAPFIAGFRVLAFARVKRPILYSGHSGLFVGPVDGPATEIGPVPCLAIAEPLRGDPGICILHCDRTWAPLGVQAGFDTVAQARQRAERMYPGITKAWQKAKQTRRDAVRLERDVWKDRACSFCRRIPPELPPEAPGFISRRGVNICEVCVREFHTALSEEDDDDQHRRLVRHPGNRHEPRDPVL